MLRRVISLWITLIFDSEGTLTSAVSVIQVCVYLSKNGIVLDSKVFGALSVWMILL